MPGVAVCALGIGLLVATVADGADLVRRASVGANRVQARTGGSGGGVSADGRYVAFGSFATNLVGDGLGGGAFLRDRLAGTTERIPLVDGSLSMSRDGRYVATRGTVSVLVYDRVTATTTTVPLAQSSARLSGDGRHIVAVSDSPLTPDDVNPGTDVYVYDLDAGTTTLASVASDGSPAGGISTSAAISADGRFVAFLSQGTNLVAGDTNSKADVFVRDTVAGTTVRASVSTGGGQITDREVVSNAAISDDGRFVAFVSGSAQLVPADTNDNLDVFVRDLGTGTTERVSVMTGGAEPPSKPASFDPVLSGDGRWVGFTAESGTFDALPNGGLFLHDRQTGTTSRIMALHSGLFGVSFLRLLDASPDGRFFLFVTGEPRLVAADTNQSVDVFVYDRLATCGDGMLDMDEECDDGNLADGDGCESDCLPTLCQGGVGIDRASARVRPNRSVTIKGDLLFPAGFPAVFDPSTTGIQVALEDVGGGLSIYELSGRNGTPVPGGPACDPADGWVVNTGGAAQRYRNRRSQALDPPLCTLGTAYALTSVRLRDRRATKGVVSFALKTARYGMFFEDLAGPFRVVVVLGATPDAGLAGACATRSFAVADCTVDGGTMQCT